MQFYGEFVESESHRRRYWARSFLGYVPVRAAEPNPTHYAVAALQRLNLASSLITQVRLRRSARLASLVDC